MRIKKSVSSADNFAQICNRMFTETFQIGAGLEKNGKKS